MPHFVQHDESTEKWMEFINISILSQPMKEAFRGIIFKKQKTLSDSNQKKLQTI